MNCGEKFPYALLFSPSPKSLSELVIGYAFSQKLVRLIVPLTLHLLPKVCRSWLLATPVTRTHTFSQKFVEAGYWVHYTPIITRTPSSTSTPYPTHPHQLYTHHTPAIHPPYTIPQPRPYPSSCELTATK